MYYTFSETVEAIDRAKSLGSGGILVPDVADEKDVVRLGMLGRLEFETEPSIGGRRRDDHLTG